MENDGILGLPEGIIAHIYSFLTIKEAARTSVLARRWKYMWTNYTHRLDFDIQVLLNLDLHKKVGVEIYESFSTIQRYIEWVYHVLKSFQDQSINEFRIYCGYHREYCEWRFDMCIKLRDCITRWVKFAIEKGVKRLELDFTYSHKMTSPHHYYMGIYPFPLQLCIDHSSSLRSLMDMSLTFVDVSDEALEYVLSKCYFLEKLSVTRSSCLVDLKVSSLSLKYLEIFFCCKLERLQVVDSVKLVSLSYEAGGKHITGFMTRNVPRLTELNIGRHCSLSNDILVKIPMYSPQLETLKYRAGWNSMGARNFPNNFPVKFKNLKHLVLLKFLNALRLTSLLKVCPSLYRLKVELVYASTKVRELKEVTKEDPYECLGVVELIGSPVYPDMVEFVFHLVQNAENLTKISLDPRPTMVYDPQTDKHTKLDEQVARSRAMEVIAPKLPPKIEFVVL